MITTDAAALEARYGNKSGPVQPAPMQDLYAPGLKQLPNNKQGQIPVGEDIPEGTIIEQRVGRAESVPSMQIVPPSVNQPRQPSMAVIPPTGTGRTSIGTFVENTGPKDLQAEPVPEIAEEDRKISAPKIPDRKPLDLVQLMLDHIFELGDEAQTFYERGPQTIVNWQRNPSVIPLGAVVKFLSRKPDVRVQIQEELDPHFAANGDERWVQMLPTRSKMSVMVLSAVLERPTLPFFWTCLWLAKKYELGFDVQSDTRIERSRDMLAHRFLRSNAMWSLWIDSDMACPISNPDWFKWVTRAEAIPEEYTAYDTLGRLMGHGKAVVGAVYASREAHGKLIIQPEVRPRSHEDRLLCNEIRRGTARGLAPVEWLGFGCVLVHREVFLEVQRRFPQLAPRSEMEPWRFFHVEGIEGEDEAFCNRVRACSIPIWLDTQLMCGHVGSQIFLPEHTRAQVAL